jgi:hypothetical protein
VFQLRTPSPGSVSDSMTWLNRGGEMGHRAVNAKEQAAHTPPAGGEQASLKAPRG